MEQTDILIIGAGPAGLCAAQYGARAGLRTLALEAVQAGGQALNIEALENYPGRRVVTAGRELVAEMREQALDFGAVLLEKEAVSLALETAGGRRFCAALADGGGVRAKAVIVCAGAKPRELGVPGEHALAGAGVSYCAACDGPFFKGKKIIVAGGGDAACDEARQLARISPHITLVHRRGQLRAQKAVAARVLEHPAITVRLNTAIKEIRGEGRVRSVLLENTENGLVTEEEAAAVFVFAGYTPRNGLVTGAALAEKPRLDADGFVVTGQDMASSVAGLFCAGDLRASPFRQIVVAAAEGAIAAHSAAEYIAAL
ncbi:MAG: FAD-dependent oxidoreductase [Spirochaetaceae bacterium]|jgi:thioredoxin reductase (NADPH)|nr:FAD-dependent oxidoreductase [Spirochaetaceae bacterium]